MTSGKWQFWVDRGGTFTDLVARRPDGTFSAHKYLSENPDQYQDAAIFGIRQIMNVPDDAPFPSNQVNSIKMGTTVATNALLEKKGAPTLLLINAGLEDALLIGGQQRQDLFALKPTRPEPLYTQVITTPARLDKDGDIITSLDADALRQQLTAVYNSGLRAIAIALMHAYKNPEHERTCAAIARDIGFTQITCSHQASSMNKLIARGDTAVVDAYLSPVLFHYRDQVKKSVGDTPLYFMQSHGGLTAADYFCGKDAILSGPAGGIVGAVKMAATENMHEIVGFDMGGTSTDVAHYAGDYERTSDTTIAGVRLSVPMMDIHTVAAGGGSICSFRDGRLQVGPESAGAHPGPAAYGKGGPLTVTDCNILVGKLHPDLFPKVFGPTGDQPLSAQDAFTRAEALLSEINKTLHTPMNMEEMAEGFLDIANEHMARAIRKISVERGHDITSHTMVCFGGAGGQHAAAVADLLSITRVFIPPFSGVLSALGMGLAPLADIRKKSTERPLTDLPQITGDFGRLASMAREHLIKQGVASDDITQMRRLYLKYQGSDSSLIIPFTEGGASGEQEVDRIKLAFEAAHQKSFGYIDTDKPIIIDTIEVEATGGDDQTALSTTATHHRSACHKHGYYKNGQTHTVRHLRKDFLRTDDPITGPVVILEDNATTVIDPDWSVTRTKQDGLILTKLKGQKDQKTAHLNENLEAPNPVLLEVFNNLFMSVAEEMGGILAHTAHSVNIKERLDFSCAVFSSSGDLVANAPHMPVHLGSMGASVQAVIAKVKKLSAGDSYMVNDPYAGGTHLPDITVISPVFYGGDTDKPAFFIASRGHHADIGGIEPGSMPANSRTIEDEGIRFTAFPLVTKGQFQEQAVRAAFAATDHPARNIDQNIADLKAQLAANQRGMQLTLKLIYHYGYEMVNRYMGFVRDNAAQAVQNAIKKLKRGDYTYPLDNGSQINVSLIPTGDRLTIDFTGTSNQTQNNFNAPLSVTRAAVLYVMRTLVDHDIPLNEGCLTPVDLIVPEGSILNPVYPAAVVAGNVEISQAVTNALFLAAGVMAASQGTMNNLTFGNKIHQYYETIAGGTGAGADHQGKGFQGTDAIHSHMTNSRLTDPEILEQRYPVLLHQFKIRHGSGGQGRYPGGNGLIRDIEFLEDMRVSILSSHRILQPAGLNGGTGGKTGKNILKKASGDTSLLNSNDSTAVTQGDHIIIKTPGGGGYTKDTNI